jgi:hypothetical protein
MSAVGSQGNKKIARLAASDWFYPATRQIDPKMCHADALEFDSFAAD